jgi:hypothetical protein
MDNTSRKRSVGKFEGIFLLFSFRKSLMELTPVLVSMFVYIAFASAEKSRALLGMVRALRSVIISKEFFV